MTLSKPQPAASRPVRVLIVDDSSVLRMALAEWLSRIPGVTVIAQAASAGEALAELETARPHLMLTDVEMPGMNGFDLARRARQMADAPRVVIMSMTNSPHYDDLTRQAGADLFIEKREIFHTLSRYLKAAFGADAIAA